MKRIIFNGSELEATTIEKFGEYLNRFDEQECFELWVYAGNDASLCMLRNGKYAFLMCIRFCGDSGMVSCGDQKLDGTVEYLLSNGQVDEYPISWCIDVDQCYKVLAYFFVNDGVFPDWVAWQST